MSRRLSGNGNRSIASNHLDSVPVFANFFSDDVPNDRSTYYPSMYDDMRDQAIANTAVPRRRLRKLLVLSMIMTLSMAILSVHSMRVFTQIGLVSLEQNHQELTNKILAHLSTQLVAAGVINDTSSIPFPQPPRSCKFSPQLCHLSLPWLYGSVISLTCALGTLQTIAQARKDSQGHARELHAIRIGLVGVGVLFCLGILEFLL